MVNISIRNLHKRFGSLHVLNDINLEIEAGELFFLLGSSGCGKTTLLRHIAGFYEPNKGQIFFGDEDVTRKPAHQRNTAMMFQSYALWPHMDVAHNVAFGLEERKVDKKEIEQRVAEALEIVKMREYAERKINQLSGGQQQRVALARALVVRPQCLLLDEPLSNLDAKLRLEMRSEIRRVCKEFGLTGVYVTHDQEEALSMADRMAIMGTGEMLQVGTPEEVYRNPVSVEVASFIGETNVVSGTVDTEGSSPGIWRVETESGLFRARVSDPDWKPTKGQPVDLSIRPEALKISDSATATNSIKATVKKSVYLGQIAQYIVETPGGDRVQLSELNPQSMRKAGDKSVYLGCEPEDVVLLRKAKRGSS